jgi:hypothetical protein
MSSSEGKERLVGVIKSSRINCFFSGHPAIMDEQAPSTTGLKSNELLKRTSALAKPENQKQ